MINKKEIVMSQDCAHDISLVIPPPDADGKQTVTCGTCGVVIEVIEQ